MQCAICGEGLPKDSNRCPRCEIDLISRCPRCGRTTPVGATTCEPCGISLTLYGIREASPDSPPVEPGSRHLILQGVGLVLLLVSVFHLINSKTVTEAVILMVALGVMCIAGGSMMKRLAKMELRQQRVEALVRERSKGRSTPEGR